MVRTLITLIFVIVSFINSNESSAGVRLKNKAMVVAENMNEAIAPSHDFLGEIGDNPLLIIFLPIKLPTKNPVISLITGTNIINK